jgi:hypothetical protein
VSVLVPLNVAVEYSEMVFNVATFLTVLVVGEKCLRAEEPAWEGFVDHHIFRNWNNFTVITNGFPIGSSNIFDFKAPSNATKNNWFIKDADGSWVNILESVGCREGTSSGNNASEGMGCGPSHVTEELPRGVKVVSERGEVMGLELICLEVTKRALVAT